METTDFGPEIEITAFQRMRKEKWPERAKKHSDHRNFPLLQKIGAAEYEYSAVVRMWAKAR